MLHHEESPVKPQYNMATPPFLDKPPHFAYPPPFSSQNFQTTPISINFEKAEPPLPLYEGGGVGWVRTMLTHFHAHVPYLYPPENVFRGV